MRLKSLETTKSQYSNRKRLANLLWKLIVHFQTLVEFVDFTAIFV